MKITLLGSLGNINQHTIPRLVTDGHEVTVVTSSSERVAAIEALGAKAAVGQMEDVDFLTKTFTGQDLVYLMIAMSGTPNEKAVEERAAIYSQAIKDSGVKQVVNLSSVGAQTPEAGILYQYHHMEDALDAVETSTVSHIRPVGFYTNLFAQLETIKSQGKIFDAISPETKRAWVATEDIADAVYARIKALLSDEEVSKSQYVLSDFASGQEWLAALAENGVQADYVKISVDQQIQGMLKAGLPKEIAEGFGQMSRIQEQPDRLYEEITAGNYHQGKVKITDFAKIFAAAVKAN
ncbi:NAD(P)H-binding protein [Lactococcus termiticola]|uniref:Nucleoside-diphosphate sugar epimerase n=1 Tax=Lactococcus termiticola TaxID=2169526 RepID=A0A2R5HEV0_9LACT|nr:NAD(P)H-binding protein [Lactococcus termiticola]GBG96583.1 nucleoside-diphosphate sugar epimerase [Lactococcus termiticola]